MSKGLWLIRHAGHCLDTFMLGVCHCETHSVWSITTLSHIMQDHPLCMLKTKKYLNKNVLGLAISCVKLSKIAKFWLSKSIFYVKNGRNLSIFFIEGYDFRSRYFFIAIFWQLHLQTHLLFCFSWNYYVKSSIHLHHLEISIPAP